MPGHAWLVRQRARLMTHRSLNGGMRRPARAAAIRAASQASQAAAARPQPISSTTQTPAPLPARSGIRGPAARVMIPAPGRARHERPGQARQAARPERAAAAPRTGLPDGAWFTQPGAAWSRRLSRSLADR